VFPVDPGRHIVKIVDKLLPLPPLDSEVRLRNEIEVFICAFMFLFGTIQRLPPLLRMT